VSFRIDEERPNLEKRFYVFKHVLDFGFIPIGLDNVCGFTLKPPPSVSLWFVKKTHTPSSSLSALMASFLSSPDPKAFDSFDAAALQLGMNRHGSRIGGSSIF